MRYVDRICYWYIHLYCRDLGVALMTEVAIASHLTTLNYLWMLHNSMVVEDQEKIRI
jgi:hypothetical protein